MSIRLNLIAVIWTSFMFILLLSPRSEAKSMYMGSVPLDPIIHVLLFVGFAHLWMSALKKQRKSNWLFEKAILLTGTFGVLLAIGLEALQYALGTGRYFQVSDIMCNLIGLVCGFLLFRLLYSNWYQ